LIFTVFYLTSEFKSMRLPACRFEDHLLRDLFGTCSEKPPKNGILPNKSRRTSEQGPKETNTMKQEQRPLLELF